MHAFLVTTVEPARRILVLQTQPDLDITLGIARQRIGKATFVRAVSVCSGTFCISRATGRAMVKGLDVLEDTRGERSSKSVLLRQSLHTEGADCDEIGSIRIVRCTNKRQDRFWVCVSTRDFEVDLSKVNRAERVRIYRWTGMWDGGAIKVSA